MLEIAMFVSEALRHFKMNLVETVYDRHPLTQKAIHIPNHPPVTDSQAGFIWRPAVPVVVTYERLP
jgi:hypothetical protein